MLAAAKAKAGIVSWPLLPGPPPGLPLRQGCLRAKWQQGGLLGGGVGSVLQEGNAVALPCAAEVAW